MERKSVSHGCSTVGLRSGGAAPRLDRNRQRAIYGQNHAPCASYSDSASPVGLEFWLPGKISVLGERGLSFACSHPSCTTRKGPLIRLSCVRGTPPLVISLCLCLSCGEAAAPFAGVGFFFFTQREVLKVLDAALQGCGHFESSITHKHKQPPSIFL